MRARKARRAILPTRQDSSNQEGDIPRRLDMLMVGEYFDRETETDIAVAYSRPPTAFTSPGYLLICGMNFLALSKTTRNWEKTPVRKSEQAKLIELQRKRWPARTVLRDRTRAVDVRHGGGSTCEGAERTRILRRWASSMAWRAENSRKRRRRLRTTRPTARRHRRRASLGGFLAGMWKCSFR